MSGIWRTEKRARFFRTDAGFLRCPVSGKILMFTTSAEAVAFLKNELAQTVGTDYEIRQVA